MQIITKERAFEVALHARRLAQYLDDYESNHPELYDDIDPFEDVQAPSYAAGFARQLAVALTDYCEGRWMPTPPELEARVAEGVFTILYIARQAGVPLADDDFEKQSWAAALLASATVLEADHPQTAAGERQMAEAILQSPKSAEELAADARSEMAKVLGRAGGLKGGKSRSRAKIAACRRNAKLGGRPANKTFTYRCIECREWFSDFESFRNHFAKTHAALAKGERRFSDWYQRFKRAN